MPSRITLGMEPLTLLRLGDFYTGLFTQWSHQCTLNTVVDFFHPKKSLFLADFPLTKVENELSCPNDGRQLGPNVPNNKESIYNHGRIFHGEMAVRSWYSRNCFHTRGFPIRAELRVDTLGVTPKKIEKDIRAQKRSGK